MSRSQILAKALAEEKLFRFTPTLLTGDTIMADEELPREMYISANVDAATMGPFPDTKEGKRRGEFRASLEACVLGGHISVSEDPYDKPGETWLARVDPVEEQFWSIRVTE